MPAEKKPEDYHQQEYGSLPGRISKALIPFWAGQSK